MADSDNATKKETIVIDSGKAQARFHHCAHHPASVRGGRSWVGYYAFARPIQHGHRRNSAVVTPGEKGRRAMQVPRADRSAGSDRDAGR
jgi:hypothetical protein